MDYSFIDDLEYAKEALSISDASFYELIGITKPSFYRWKKNKYIFNKIVLDRIYSVLYNNGLDYN